MLALTYMYMYVKESYFLVYVNVQFTYLACQSNIDQ